MLKRGGDIVVAALGLLMLAPVMGLVALWIRLSSPGPIFYSQTRVGRAGRQFRLRKFRTMVINADRLGTSVTTAVDPRVTPIGRFLRRTKLDEIPQLWNVLIGDMSLVGPRPDVPEIVATYTPEMRRILEARPGITSIASLYLRREEDLLALADEPDEAYLRVVVPAKVDLAMSHVKGASLRFDLAILARTVWTLVARKDAPAAQAFVGGLRERVLQFNEERKRVPNKRIYLSSPHLSGQEQRYVQEAFDTNWIAPLGPHVDAFEREFGEAVGAPHAVALSSGTAAIHLALLLAGVGRDDEVLVSTLTFSASVNPIVYLGARPVFVDSEPASWNMDPALLADALGARAKRGRLPRAVVLVHLYGQSADVDPIRAACERYEVPLVEDAAEALGATYKGRAAGTFGRAGIFSFNGNKIITTSGGGMLVSPDGDLIAHARKLATQARDAAPHYEHSEIGYNYRMSNLLAGVGRAQLQVLGERVAARRRNCDYYGRHLGDLPGISFMPEAAWGRHTRWLTCILVDPAAFGADREAIRLALERENIEARPVWKPMHLQPVFRGYERIGGEVSERLFERGLCLPSGSNLTESDLERVVAGIRALAQVRQPAALAQAA